MLHVASFLFVCLITFHQCINDSNREKQIQYYLLLTLYLALCINMSLQCKLYSSLVWNIVSYCIASKDNENNIYQSLFILCSEHILMIFKVHYASIKNSILCLNESNMEKTQNRNCQVFNLNEYYEKQLVVCWKSIRKNITLGRFG